MADQEREVIETGRPVILTMIRRRDADGLPLIGYAYPDMGAIDHGSGEPLLSVMDVKLVISPDIPILTAEMTMLCDPDDKPLVGKHSTVCFIDDGEPRSGLYRWLVAEIRAD